MTSEISFAIVDDNSRELESFSELLNSYGKSYNVEFISFCPENNNSVLTQLKIILNSKISGIIIDQRLHDSSPITFTGAELCKKIRQERRNFPTYILTKYNNDENISENAEHIDFSFSKKSFLVSPEYSLKQMLSLARRYNTIREEDMNRLDILIVNSFSRNLTLEEQREMNNIRTAYMLAGLVDNSVELENRRKENRVINEKIDSAIELINKIINNED